MPPPPAIRAATSPPSVWASNSVTVPRACRCRPRPAAASGGGRRRAAGRPAPRPARRRGGSCRRSWLAPRQRQPPLDQADAAEHGGEQIVEIVGDAAGQLADRVHLAGLEQLLLELLALGDVEQGAGILRRPSVRRRAAAPPGRGNACTGRRRIASDIRPPSRRSRRVAQRREGALAVVGVEPVGPQVGVAATASNGKPVSAAKLPPTNCGTRGWRPPPPDRG